MVSAQRKNNVSYVLFLLLPLAALVSSLRNYKIARSRNIVWLFIVFYGFTFVFSSTGLDSDRYKKSLVFMAGQQTTSFSDFAILLYNEETSYVDIVQPLLTFLVSRFTSNAHILFAFFGLIFGYFYSRNLWFLLSFVEEKIKLKAIPFLVLAGLMIAIWQINGFRFWTAAHIFIYGICLLVQGKNVKGLLVSISSVFMHFSFVLPVGVLLLYLFIGNRFFVALVLYFLSFFLAQISPESVKEISKSLPVIFQERTKSYLNKDYIKLRSTQNVSRNWYLEGRIQALTYSLNLLLLVIAFKYRNDVKSLIGAGSFFTIGLLLASLSNIFGGIPSMIRFQSVAFLILIFALFMLVQISKRMIFSRWVYAPFLLASVLYCVVEIRIGFDTIGPITLLGNPIVALFIPNDIPLIDYIK